jgi:flagellar biosynthetic protein FliO
LWSKLKGLEFQTICIFIITGKSKTACRLTYNRTNVSIHVMFLVGQTLAGSWQSYGIFILQTVAVLAVIALAAWGIVRFGGHRLGRGKGEHRMRVVERLGLEPKRSIYLIEVDGKSLLIGVSEGSVRLLEHGPDKAETTDDTAPAEVENAP